MRLATLVLALFVQPALADAVVAARLLKAQTVISAEDIVLVPEGIAGALSDPSLAIGKELSVTLYPGKPISAEHLRQPAVIERNQIVRLVYNDRGLTIEAEGRALDRAARGDLVRVMNLQSKNTITGIARADSSVSLSGKE